MKTSQSQHFEQLRMVNLRHEKYMSQYQTLKEHSSVTCNLSRMPSVYFEKWSSQKFPQSRNCILLKHFFRAFFERICKYLFDPDTSRNMVLTHEDLSSCRLKLEVVAMSVVNSGSYSWKKWYPPWSALKLRQVEWPHWISDKKNEQENATYFFPPEAKMKNLRYVHIFEWTGTCTPSQKKNTGKTHTQTSWSDADTNDAKCAEFAESL